jgi:hypothetical protein
MVSHCVVANKLVVSNDFKTNWVPDSEEVDGSMFMRICKWDRCFVKFCTGMALRFSGGTRQDVNVDFVDKLQRLRTAAVDTALAAVLEQEPDGSKKRKRIRKARIDDRDILPQVFTIICPALEQDEQCIHEELSMRVLFGVKNHDLWMEAKEVNLEYVRLGILFALHASQHGRKRSKLGNIDGVARDESSHIENKPHDDDEQL